MRDMLLLIFCVTVLAFILFRSDPVLPTAKLPLYNDGVSARYGQNVGACDQEYCVVAYVAPWCGVCRQYTEEYVKLRDALAIDGIDMKIVIGRDKPKAVEAYAREFAGASYNDANGHYYRLLGLEAVPYFAVINRDGEIVKETFGSFRSVNEFRTDWEI
uniref:TlpA family protein disulfide reductase n=1 Tax=Thaumasiovibrio occultus TaxID=1891184 RepID=UPI000B35DE8B|nr:redoxin family protein [Thaumasiovibrio occultus]